MKKLFFCCLLILVGIMTNGQSITYSEPERTDSRQLNFEIIGKLNEHYLIYKNYRSKYSISVYDDNMDVINDIPLEFMPEKTLNVNFIPYDDFAWMIYQYQKKNIVYCMGAKVNSDGKVTAEPMLLDTTEIGFFAENKIYSTVHSEDKNRILVFKIQKDNNRFNFTTLLFDKHLKLLDKTRIGTNYNDRKHVFGDFYVTNQGDFVFTAGNRSSAREYLKEVSLITKAPRSDSFRVKHISLHDRYLDEIKLEVDNMNRNYILNSFYYEEKRGNVVGLFTAVIDQSTFETKAITFAQIKDNIRSDARERGKEKYALNNFFIRDVILKKNGGFILTAEDFSADLRSNTWNRYDYLYGYPGIYSPHYYYYSPYSYGYYGNRFYDYRDRTRYNYNNILVLSVDSSGHYSWADIINKNQYSDEGDNLLSYTMMLTGGRLHFLFNEVERRNMILADRSITGSGDITRHPPMHDLDRGYEFMPRYARQVSADELLIPCMYRNYICFARIEY